MLNPQACSPLMGISFRRELGHNVMCASNSTKLELPEPCRVPCRPLQPQDKADLIAAHRAAFPINYENAFFERAVHGHDGVISWAAVHRQNMPEQMLVGFVTARLFRLHECHPTDRAIIGLASKLLDQEAALYILTLGVAEGFRHLGIASRLVAFVVQHARDSLCRAVYLHVIDYNKAAIQFYRRNEFEELALIRRFYKINSGRQPNPNQQEFDAYLYAYQLDTTVSASPLALLGAAYAPFRGLIGYILTCLPWQMRRPQSYFKNMFAGSRDISEIKLEQGQMLVQHSSHRPPFLKHWLLQYFTRST